MSSFPVPPITQWQVETRLADGTLVDSIALVNSQADLEALLAELAAEREDDAGFGAIVGIVVVSGRRRLNDYVGSPIWSAWEVTGSVGPDGVCAECGRAITYDTTADWYRHTEAGVPACALALEGPEFINPKEQSA